MMKLKRLKNRAGEGFVRPFKWALLATFVALALGSSQSGAHSAIRDNTPQNNTPGLTEVASVDVPYAGMSKLDMVRRVESKHLSKTSPSAPSINLTRVQYGSICAAEMGTIPAFNCLDGEELEVKTGAVKHTQPVNDCDRPVHLGINGLPCTPFSRLLLLETGNSSATTYAICRKYADRTNDYYTNTDTRFQDIAIVQHNRVTGHTCWFQSPPDVDQNGSATPSPMADSAAANNFWLEPAATGNINCQQCHDADPFIRTPYIAQTTLVGGFGANLHWDPQGYYTANFLGIFAPAQSEVVAPTNNACVSCHRVGPSAFGLLLSSITPANQTASPGGLHPWMPPGSTPDQSALDQLKRCLGINNATPNPSDQCNKRVPVKPTIPASPLADDLAATQSVLGDQTSSLASLAAAQSASALSSSSVNTVNLPMVTK